MSKSTRNTIDRRRFLKTSAAAAAHVAASPLFAPAVHAQNAKLKLGYVTPQTGPLAAFAEADDFIIKGFMEATKGGVEAGGSTFDLEVVVKDSQSNPNRAAEVAKELIVDDEIDLMLVASTPETTNPVSTQCEIEELPCISTMAPWQPWFIGRQGNPGGPASWKPFNYTYHYFWGLEDVIAVFTNMWSQLDTNKVGRRPLPQRRRRQCLGRPERRLPAGASKAAGYETDRSRPLPEPDRRFLGADHRVQECRRRDRHRRRAAAGLHHLLEPGATSRASSRRRVSVGKAILFPSSVEALGEPATTSPPRSGGRRTIRSSPRSPASRQATSPRLRSGDGPPVDAADRLHPLAVRGRGRRAEARRGSEGPDRRCSTSIAATNLETVVGQVNWDGANLPPFAAKNVAKTPLVGGQWRRKDDGKFDLVIVDNQTAPNIPAGGKMEPIG